MACWTILSITFSVFLLKAGFSTAAEIDSSVWSSDALRAQLSFIPGRRRWLSFVGRFAFLDGFSLLRIVWPFPSPLVLEGRYYGRC